MSIKYKGTILKKDIEIEKLISLHYFEYVKNFQGLEECHNFWEAVYVDSGEITVKSNTNHFVLKQGDMIFHKPNELHNVIARKCFATVCIFSFTCNSYAMIFFNNQILYLSIEERKFVADFFFEGKNVFKSPYNELNKKKLTKKEQIPFGAEQLTKMNLEKLLIILIRNRQTPNCNKSEDIISDKIKIEAIEIIIQFLEKNVEKKLSLDMIVSQSHISKSYLEKLFHDKLQCGIMHYFLKLRLNMAKKLISENKYTFTEIAERLQFESIHHFSKTFKNFTGMTPSQYKQSVKIRALL
ncbi:MAG: AraC family transcriptional regulator [Treponemataceae bacterium]